MLTEEIKTMSQTDLIRLHQQFSADAVESQLELRDSYDHLLLSLRRLIESHGPTQEYQDRSYAVGRLV